MIKCERKAYRKTTTKQQEVVEKERNRIRVVIFSNTFFFLSLLCRPVNLFSFAIFSTLHKIMFLMANFNLEASRS